VDALAVKYGFYIIEDDVNYFCQKIGVFTPAQQAPDRGVFLSSLSQIRLRAIGESLTAFVSPKQWQASLQCQHSQASAWTWSAKR